MFVSSCASVRVLIAALATLGAGTTWAAEAKEAASKEPTRKETTRKESTAPRSRIGGHSEGRFIQGWDTDGDGKVSRAEYEAARKQRFAATDEDGNGALSVDEYVDEYAVRLDRQIAGERKASIEQTHTRFRALDKDGDGLVSRVEYDASGGRAFEHLDHDKDGRITAKDPEVSRSSASSASGVSGVSGVEAKSASEREKLASEASRPRRRSVIAMPSTHSRAGFLEIYDGDGDGVVTREQYDALRDSAFARTDANADGKLDQREYVDEFADRLDRQIERTRRAQLKQGRVRFESIDSDKNGSISRDEYFAMSTRQFERADTDKNGIVSADDPPPARDATEQAAREATRNVAGEPAGKRSAR